MFNNIGEEPTKSVARIWQELDVNKSSCGFGGGSQGRTRSISFSTYIDNNVSVSDDGKGIMTDSDWYSYVEASVLASHSMQPLPFSLLQPLRCIQKSSL